MILIFSDQGDWGVGAMDLFDGRFHNAPQALDAVVKYAKVGDHFSLYDIEADRWSRYVKVRGQDWEEVEVERP